MLPELKDYAKCALRNKWVIGSYAGIGAACLIKYIERETGTELPAVDYLLYLSLCPSAFILGATNFGAGTYRAYRRMRVHIEEHGTIEPRLRDKLSKWYCTQVGIRMAAEEAGLEELV